jgi:hypothetical protein
LDKESVRTFLGLFKPHSSASKGEISVMTTATRGAYSSAEYAFQALLHDSVTEVFSGTLGKIAGEALLEAIKKHAPSEGEDPLEKPELLDQMLIAHLGLVAQVLERRILRTLGTKTATAASLRENGRVDFPLEVEKIRKQFLKRKQAADRPQALE